MKIKRLPNSEDVMEALKANDGYCPCKIEKTPETKCMCKQFLDQTIDGDCECGLYTKSFED